MQTEQQTNRLSERGFRREMVDGLDLSSRAQIRRTPWGLVSIDFEDGKWIVQAHVVRDGKGVALSRTHTYGDSFSRFGLAISVAHECALVSGMVGLSALGMWLEKLD